MFYTYILTNPGKSVLYTGHTDDLTVRMPQHQSKNFGGFTAKYNCSTLIWFEIHDSRDAAFTRERQIKAWKREWKRELIAELNPRWGDLFARITVDELYAQARMHPDTRARLNL